MRILGIETSCDETAAAVVEDGKKLLSNVVATSMELHAAYGGVVPEIAARSHIEFINPVIEQALHDADCSWDDIDGIAVTYGAGLGGSLLVGVLAARTLAIIKQKPLYAINHVEGHVYANFLTETAPSLASTYQMPSAPPAFPVLALIVSGGHTQLVLFRDHFDFVLLGQTHDDAIGEAFDKVAKVIGLPYPGGPSIASAAKTGNPDAYQFPKAKTNLVNKRLEELRSGRPHQGEMPLNYDFSFSGPKTAVLRAAQKICGKSHDFPSSQLAALLSEAQKADIAASFQRVAVETVVDKAVLAFQEFNPSSLVIAGGVAANQELRKQMSDRIPLPVQYADIKLCTDNGAMIATLGCYKAMNNQPTADPYSLEIQPNLSM